MHTKSEIQDEIKRVEALISMLTVQQKDAQDLIDMGISTMGLRNNSGRIQELKLTLSKLQGELRPASD